MHRLVPRRVNPQQMKHLIGAERQNDHGDEAKEDCENAASKASERRACWACRICHL